MSLRRRWRGSLTIPFLAMSVGVYVTALGPLGCGDDGGTAVNHAPVIVPLGEHAVLLGGTLQLVLDATDPDGDDLTFLAEVAPPGLTLVGDQLTWTPSAGDVGQEFFIVVSASDDGVPPLTAYEGFTVRVVDPDAPGPNHPPVADPLPDQQVIAGQTLTFTVTGLDPDGDDLSWQATGLPLGAAFDPATGQFAWTPGVNDAGYHYASFRLLDDGTPSLKDTLLVDIRVSAPDVVNLPPAWITWMDSALLDACVATPFTATFEAIDAEGGTITYSASPLPAGATFTPQGTAAVLDLSAVMLPSGTHWIVIAAQDDHSPAAAISGAYRIEVPLPPLSSIDFTNLGTYSTPSLVEAPVTVTGSADIYVLNYNGLGIVGGAYDNTVDTTEWIELTFTEPLAEVSYFVSMAGNGDMDSYVGEATLEAWDEAQASLGTVPMDGGGTKAVSGSFGGALISRFRVSARDGDIFRLGSLQARFCP